MKKIKTIFKEFGKKGDVNRYILYTIVLLILLIIIITLTFSGAQTIIKNFFIKEVLK